MEMVPRSGCWHPGFAEIPHLSPAVIAIHIDATDTATESLLLRRLRRDYSTLSPELSLTETLTVLRREITAPIGPKLLIVLDQFEQWLHANNDS